ncbi:hypothetical protein MA16_Dca011240 [Dendrobium catenatum]|uniref:DUF4218 domain-containing protein n=1 Tax=Dendrobium catenatum TaxID=906689 RepID=A0A2I0WIG9_9ASPA|nr:hypothetical protein MA16_Dca011240 [Dendrobium catenatum]
MPIALSSCAPSNEVLNIIVGISHFLKFIFARVINPIELDKKQKEIALTLCNMEKYFLPSFFTIMVHLLIHLVEEVRLGGPVHYRWMYPFERFFLVLKDFVRNKSQPERSIAERYIAEEGISFFSKYLDGAPTFSKSISARVSSKDDGVSYKFLTDGILLGQVSIFVLDDLSLI